MSSHIIFEIITILNTRAHVITVEFDFFDERNILSIHLFFTKLFMQGDDQYFFTRSTFLWDKKTNIETGVANVKSNGAEKSAVLVVVKRS